MRFTTVFGLSLALVACAADPGSPGSASAGGKADGIGLSFEDADLQCFDGQIEIGLYGHGIIDVDPWKAIGESDSVIKVREYDGTIHVLDKGVIFTDDGAGNTVYQVLHHDLEGFEITTDLYYDHEVGDLVGYYSIPIYKTGTLGTGETFEYLDGFDRHEIEGSEMECYDYTFGDL